MTAPKPKPKIETPSAPPPRVPWGFLLRAREQAGPDALPRLSEYLRAASIDGDGFEIPGAVVCEALAQELVAAEVECRRLGFSYGHIARLRRRLDAHLNVASMLSTTGLPAAPTRPAASRNW